MAQHLSSLTQSRFYSPVLNSAIFDGAVRIYFAQFQEPEALKIYFRLQDLVRKSGLEPVRRSIRGLYIVIYPTAETFELCWPTDEAKRHGIIAQADWDDDFVLGMAAPMTEAGVNDLFDLIPSYLTLMAESHSQVSELSSPNLEAAL